MIEAIQSLLRLQEVDLQLHEYNTEVASFRPSREAATARCRDEAAASEVAEQVVAEVEHRHRTLERELAEAEALLEKLNTQLYEVTSKHALEALQSELSRAETRKSEGEDKILELLDRLDDATHARDGARREATEGVASSSAEDAQMAAREQVLSLEIARLETLRGTLSQGLETHIARAYDGARRKRLPAVVFVEARNCPVCQMTLGPQKLIELGAATVLVHCGTCDRILYGDKVAEAERASVTAG